MVDHSLLLQKLALFGLNTLAVQWWKSQSVLIDCHLSPPVTSPPSAREAATTDIQQQQNKLSLKDYWYALKTSLKDARNTLETSLTSLKYPWNYIERPLNLPWNTHHWNFLEISVKLTWNLLETCLTLAWIMLETYLKHLKKTFEIPFKLPWNYLETFNFRDIPLKLP